MRKWIAILLAFGLLLPSAKVIAGRVAGGFQSLDVTDNVTVGGSLSVTGSATVGGTTTTDILVVQSSYTLPDNATLVTVPVTGSQIDNGTLNLNNFPATIRPIKSIAALPTCGDSTYPEGSVVYLTTDYKLYRCAVDNAWKSFVDNTDITGTLTDAQIASLAAAKLTGTISSTQIADNSITTPKLSTALVIAGNLIADNAITNNLIADNAIIRGAMIADNIITNNMLVGSIAASKLSVDNLSALSANMGTLTAGTIQQSYTAPGDDNTTAGAGLKITGGKIEAYGGDQTFGGTIITSDGTYMVCIGKYLTAAGLLKRYPLNNGTNFGADGQIHIYFWDTVPVTDTWVEAAHLGAYSAGGWTSALDIYGTTSTATGIHMRDGGGGAANKITDGIDILIYGGASGGYGARAEHYGTNSIGVRGYGTQLGGWFISDESGYGPITLNPSSSASAPTHAAYKGTLWVDNAALLYINTDGSTTWQKVGAQ